jgi:hypothetical protein
MSTNFDLFLGKKIPGVHPCALLGPPWILQIHRGFVNFVYSVNSY